MRTFRSFPRTTMRIVPFFVFSCFAVFWTDLHLRLAEDQFLQAIAEFDVERVVFHRQLSAMQALAGALGTNETDADRWQLRKGDD